MATPSSGWAEAIFWIFSFLWLNKTVVLVRSCKNSGAGHISKHLHKRQSIILTDDRVKKQLESALFPNTLIKQQSILGRGQGLTLKCSESLNLSFQLLGVWTPMSLYLPNTNGLLNKLDQLLQSAPSQYLAAVPNILWMVWIILDGVC